MEWVAFSSYIAAKTASSLLSPQDLVGLWLDTWGLNLSSLMYAASQLQYACKLLFSLSTAYKLGLYRKTFHVLSSSQAVVVMWPVTRLQPHQHDDAVLPSRSPRGLPSSGHIVEAFSRVVIPRRLVSQSPKANSHLMLSTNHHPPHLHSHPYVSCPKLPIHDVVV